MGIHSNSGAFEVKRPARFHWSEGQAPRGSAVRVVALHGYAMNAVEMLDWTRRLLGPEADIASLEGPNSFNLGRDPRTSACGYNWGTRETTDFHVALHHQMIDGLMERLGWAADSTLLLGYSQSVGLNYRYLADHPRAVRACAGLCGGIPANWDETSSHAISASILHIARLDDEFFHSANAPVSEARLRSRVPDLEFHLLPGKHRFPFNASDLVQRWVRRVFGH